MTSGRIRTKLIEDVLAFLDEGERAGLMKAASALLRDTMSMSRVERPEWCPVALFTEAMGLLERFAERGELDACREAGRFVATREVGPVQELAMRVLRPSMIVSLAPGIFVTHFQECGKVSVRTAGSHSLMVTLIDFPEPSRPQCRAIEGWMEGWLSLGPRKAVRARHGACRCDGASVCEYAASWEE